MEVKPAQPIVRASERDATKPLQITGHSTISFSYIIVIKFNIVIKIIQGAFFKQNMYATYIIVYFGT